MSRNANITPHISGHVFKFGLDDRECAGEYGCLTVERAVWIPVKIVFFDAVPLRERGVIGWPTRTIQSATDNPL